MKVLFAVNNEKISDNIIKRYQKEYKEILSFKNVYYFDAILKEIQKDKSYDRIVISEDLEPFSNNNYDAIDKFIFDKLDNISDEAQDLDGNDTPIVLICADRRTKGSSFLVKIFGIGIYNALLGTERSMEQVCKLINKPRVKKEAKQYYKIDSEDVSYSKESDKEVSEIEIQNINIHFKKLGKNTDKYAESFANIAAQYTDDQLKIVINCLPPNVRKVLATDSPKYQELMSISSDDISKMERDSINTQNAQQNTGIRIDIIDNKMNENKMSGPIVIPASVKTSKNKTPQPVRPAGNNIEVPQSTNNSGQRHVKIVDKKHENKQDSVQEMPRKKVEQKQEKKPEIIEKKVVMPDGTVVIKKVRKLSPEEKAAKAAAKAAANNAANTTSTKEVKKATIPPVLENKDKIQKQKKAQEDSEDDFMLPMSDELDDDLNNNVVEDEFENIEKTNNKSNTNLDEENDDDLGLPGLDDFEDEELPGLDDSDEDEALPGLDDSDEDETLPGLDDFDEDEGLPGLDDFDEDEELPGLDDSDEEETLPGLDDFDEDEELPGLDDEEFEEVDEVDENNEEEFTDEVALPGLDELDDFDNSQSQGIPGVDDEFDDDSILGEDFEEEVVPNTANQTQNQSTNLESIKPKVDYSMSNLNSLLTKDKKIVTFIGTTKNGTSFLVNNLAALFSSLGISTAILDMTKNRNSYYIYTNNEEELRNIAYNSISKLQNGFTEGIKVNNNLTVYTALPNDGKDYQDAETILSTMVQKYSLILIDCDFDTSPAYFASCQEIYLVQSMDILTIQPLTAFLRDLKNVGVLEPEKVRVVINKEIKVKSLNEKAIIGGMSFYNDPSMSYMNELFNKDMVKACTIPFEDAVYAKYLDFMATCSISIKEYSKTFLNKLKILGNMVYPLVSKSSSYGSGSEKSYSKNNNASKKGFSKDINATLDQMKKKI